MKLSFKKYKLSKLKPFIKSNKLFFLVNGLYKNSTYWLKTEQILTKLNLKLNKIPNKAWVKILQHSIHLRSRSLINGTLFTLTAKPSSKLFKNKDLVTQKLRQFFFLLLALNLNNKVYSLTQIKELPMLMYKENILINLKFLNSRLKSISK